MGSCMNMLSFIDVGLPVEFHSSVCQYLFFTGEIIGTLKKKAFSFAFYYVFTYYVP